jgi:hypothetical protein
MPPQLHYGVSRTAAPRLRLLNLPDPGAPAPAASLNGTAVNLPDVHTP